MTAQDDNRRRIEELLPFYLNGTLDEGERVEVEAALAESEDLRWELEFLEGVQRDVQTRDPGRSPGDFGLARLMRDIEAEGRVSAPVVQSRSRVWQIAAAVALALFATQTVLVVTSPGTLVELAGGETAGAKGPTLTVAFVPEASEAEIRALLLANGLEIVGGPSALGLWTVAVSGDGSAAEAVAALRAESGLVESAEED
jgi:anti-sigma factor RsiW